MDKHNQRKTTTSGRFIIQHAINYIRWDRWDGTNTTTRTRAIDNDEIAAIDILLGALLDTHRIKDSAAVRDSPR